MTIALIIIGALLFLLCGHFTAIYFIFLKFFKRTSLKKIDKSVRSTSYSKPFAEEMIATREEILAKKEYEIVEVTSFDNLKLTGYYFNKNSDKTIIMIHGLRTHAFNNFGYATKYFLAKGYNVLAVNQRAHEGSEAKYTTYGQKESQDVLTWISYVSENTDTKNIYLYGISMGATSIALASENMINPKLRCLIIESVYTSVDALTTHLMKSQHVPGFLFARTVKWMSHRFAGVNWNARTTVDALRNNKLPCIFVHGTKDIVAIKGFFEDNYNNCFSNKYSIIVEGAPHALIALYDKENYLDKLNKILGEHYE